MLKVKTLLPLLQFNDIFAYMLIIGLKVEGEDFAPDRTFVPSSLL